MLPEEIEDAHVSPETGPAADVIGPDLSEPFADPLDGVTPLETVPPPPVGEPFWGYSDIAIVIGLLFAASILIGLVVALIAFPYPALRADPTPLAMPVQLVFYAALYLVFWLVFKIRHQRPVLSSLGWKKPNVNLLWLVLGGILMAFAVSAVGVMLRTPKIESPFDKLTKTRFSLALFAVVAALLAPLFEEMFFRGFLQPVFSRTFGTIAGVVITAIFFGALHGFEYSWVWQYAFLISLVGMVLGFIRARTNSIIPGTVMHACFNAVSVVALAFGKNI